MDENIKKILTGKIKFFNDGDKELELKKNKININLTHKKIEINQLNEELLDDKYSIKYKNQLKKKINKITEEINELMVKSIEIDKDYNECLDKKKYYDEFLNVN